MFGKLEYGLSLLTHDILLQWCLMISCCVGWYRSHRLFDTSDISRFVRRSSSVGNIGRCSVLRRRWNSDRCTYRRQVLHEIAAGLSTEVLMLRFVRPTCLHK